jgi:hypothetical protein
MKALAASIVLILLLPSGAAADEFSEYRIPEHSWRAGYLNFSGDASRAQQSSESWRHETKDLDVFGSLNLDLSWEHDADRRQHGWQVVMSDGASLSRGEVVDEYSVGNPYTSSDRSQQYSQWLRLSQWARVYPGTSCLGVDLSWSFDTQLQQGWGRGDSRQYGAPGVHTLSRSSSQLHDYRYSGTLRAAFGHGLVREVTTVEDVHVLEGRLLETGAITRPLSAATREKLAAVLAVAPNIRAAHERSERYLWREIEKVLSEDGALAVEGLDAYSLERAREPWTMRLARRRGHFAGIVLAVDHEHNVTRIDSQYGTKYFYADTLAADYQGDYAGRATSSGDQVRGGVTAEWYRPAGWNWQWSARGEVTVPLRSGERGLRTDNRVDASWHIADRWAAQAALLCVRDYVESGSRKDSVPRDRWNAGSSLSLSYFLEDRASISLRLDDTQGRTRSAWLSSDSATSEFQHRTQFVAAVTYRFLGQFSAPGLFDTMTPRR